MSNAIQTKQATPVDRLKSIMDAPSVAKQFENALKENSNLFVASLIDLYASDNYLQQCNPAQVVAEALKAATLKLPINKSLGFAYIVPYKSKGQQVPQFQLGYKGMIQLAMRSGQYRFLNDGIVYEGQFKGHNILTGELDLSGEKTSDTAVGYFAYIETVNGFKKSLYCSKEDMQKHGKKYSKSFGFAGSPWQTEFDSMARKTMLRQLLGKYGVMSVDMAEGMAEVENEEHEDDYRHNGNSELIDIPPQNVNTETGEVSEPEEPPMDSRAMDEALAAQEQETEVPY